MPFLKNPANPGLVASYIQGLPEVGIKQTAVTQS